MNGNEKIGNFMTPCPNTVGPKATVAEALQLMEKEGIRHLPVVDGEKAIGLLSEREIKRFESLMDTTATLVVNVMVKSPYTAPQSTPISNVVDTMSERKIGSTVVTGPDGDIVGIFTTTDVLNLFKQEMN